MNNKRPDQAEELRQLFQEEQEQKERGIDVLELPARKEIHKHTQMHFKLNRYLLRFFAVLAAVIVMIIYFII